MWVSAAGIIVNCAEDRKRGPREKESLSGVQALEYKGPRAIKMGIGGALAPPVHSG